MIGLGQDDKPRLVGAKEKREMARRLKSGKFDDIKSKREGAEPSLAAPVALVYVLSATVAWFMTDSSMQKALDIHTGDRDLDRFMFGLGVPDIMGDATMDLVLAVALRGLVIFLAAGIIPGMAWLWIRVLDNARTNIYIACWGTPVGLALIYYAIADLLMPLLEGFM